LWEEQSALSSVSSRPSLPWSRTSEPAPPSPSSSSRHSLLSAISALLLAPARPGISRIFRCHAPSKPPRRNPALSLSRRRHHGCGGRRPPSHQSHRGDPRNFHPPDTGRKDDLRPPGRSFRSGIAPSRRSHNRPGQPRVKRGQWPRFLAPRSRSSVEFFSLFRIRSCLVATPSEEFLFHPVLEVNSGFCNRA